MYVIYERIDDDQERTQIDMILCFDNEDFANKWAEKLRKNGHFKGELVVDFVIKAENKGV